MDCLGAGLGRALDGAATRCDKSGFAPHCCIAMRCRLPRLLPLLAEKPESLKGRGQYVIAHARYSECRAFASSRLLSSWRDIATGQHAGPPRSRPLGRHARLPGLDALTPAEYQRRSSAQHVVLNGRPPRSSADRAFRPLSHCSAPLTWVADRCASGGALRHSCVVSCALHLRRWGGAGPWTGPHGEACPAASRPGWPGALCWAAAGRLAPPSFGGGPPAGALASQARLPPFSRRAAPRTNLASFLFFGGPSGLGPLKRPIWTGGEGGSFRQNTPLPMPVHR
jgi:hypothetical protein